MAPDASFGTLVQNRRLAIGLTQAELATRVGCATITIRKIESDAMRPSTQIAERLAMALDIPLDERAIFVRLARTSGLKTPDPIPTPTPPPLPEEIGEEDLTGRAVRGFQLGERIGAGGFGAVYRAVQPGVEREVAIKIILPQYANHPDFIRRFEAEAQLVARLEHPHIVPLYDYWREPDAAYLVMRLLRGGSLKDRLQGGALPLEDVLRLVDQIGAALHSAHRFGVIHRDLKPANILLDEDQNAYLADFGIAKNLGNPNLEDKTQTGAFIGSPAYISPEQIRSDSIRPQADIYCLGVLLFEMLTGSLPFQGPTPMDYIMQHLNHNLPSITALNPVLPAALDSVVWKATAKDPADRYEDIPSLLAELNPARPGQGIDPAITGWETMQDGEGTEIANPFKGLRPFGEADAEHFFGREQFIQRLLGRLAEEKDVSRFLGVVGPSGSGKSSLVKAGLIPALRWGGLPGSEQWFVVDFMPGPHPFEELEAALLRVAVNPPATLLEQLLADERGLLRAVRRILPGDETSELVLVIDQFEELFTLVGDEAIRRRFLDSLIIAVMDPRSRLRVIITMRADFTDRPLQYVDFGELMEARSVFVLPLTPDELEKVLTGPARHVGLALEPGLTARIVRELGDQPGTLPLLQYALTELFERRDGRKLTLAAYQEIGGVLGALGRRAEEIYTGLDEPAQSAARQLFLRLVTLGEGVEDTRRRVLRTELTGLAGGVVSSTLILQPLETYGKARLLTFDHDPVTRGPTVEVAHEALLREWPRLRGWLNQSRGDVRLQRILANATAEWLAAGREAGLLLRGTRLTQLESWANETTLALTADESLFLEASLEGRKARQAAELDRQERERKLEQRSRSFLRGLVGVFAAATAIALLLSIYAFNQRSFALTEASSRATQQVIAQEQAALAATSAAEAQAQQALAEDETLARATQQTIAEEQAALASVQQALAEEQARLAFSRELVAGSILNLDTDPELSILLALQALDQSLTFQAEQALHDAVMSSHLLERVSGRPGEGFGNAVYSPDGTRIAVSGFGPEGEFTQVRDAETLELLFTFPGGLADDIWVDTNRIPLASAGDDPGNSHLITIWNADGLLVSEYSIPVAWYDTNSSVELFTSDINPDQTMIAIAAWDGSVAIYELATGERLNTVVEPSQADYSHRWIRYSPDGSLLLFSNNLFVTLWDIASERILLTRPTGIGNLQFPIAFSPDGKQFAYYNASSITIVDIASGNDVKKFYTDHSGQVKPIIFNPDGTQIATVGSEGSVRIWELETGLILINLRLITTPGAAIAFSPDGTRLLTVNGTELPTGGPMFSTSSGIIQLRGLDAAASREWLTVPGAGDSCGIAVSPDGNIVAVPPCNDSVALLDGITGQPLKLLSDPGEGEVAFPTYNPDGTLLAAVNLGVASEEISGDRVVVWDTSSGLEVSAFTAHQDSVWDLSFNPDGTRLATISYDKTAQLWDWRSGEVLFTMEVYTDSIYVGTNPIEVAYSPDGSRLATSGGSSVKIWDATSGELLLSLSKSQQTVYGIAFSPNGTRLAVGIQGGAASVWDAVNGQKLFDLIGHSGSVYDIAYSPNGNLIATGGLDGTIRLWDADTGVELLILKGHPILAIYLAFSPDGTRLFTQGWDGKVIVYALVVEDLIDIALARLTRWFTPAECLLYLHTETCPPDVRP